MDEFFGSNNLPLGLLEAAIRWVEADGKGDWMDRWMLEEFVRHHVKLVDDGAGCLRGV